MQRGGSRSGPPGATSCVVVLRFGCPRLGPSCSSSIVVEVSSGAVSWQRHGSSAFVARFAVLVLVLGARQDLVKGTTDARRLHGQKLPVKHVIVRETLAEEELSEQSLEVIVVRSVVESQRAHVLKVRPKFGWGCGGWAGTAGLVSEWVSGDNGNQGVRGNTV